MQHSIHLYRAIRPKAAQHGLSLAKRRHWFADDDATTTPDATDTQPEQSGATGQDAQTFTQADVDRIVGERAKRASEAAQKKLLEDLGFESPDDLKTLVAEAKKRKEAEMSEAEKLQAQITALQAEKQAAEAKAQEAEQKAVTMRRNSAIITALKDAEKPQSVLTLLEAEHADMVAAVLTDDGTVNEKTVTELVDIARKDYSGMFKSQAPGTGSHANGKLPSNEKQKQRIRDSIRIPY